MANDTKSVTAVVKVTETPGTIVSNMEDLEAYVSSICADYVGIDIADPTAEQARWAKTSRTEVNRVAKAIAAERIRVEKAYMAPFQSFKDRCMDLEGRLKATSADLKKVVDAGEEKRRAQRRIDLQEAYEELAPLLVPVVPLDALMDPSWLNKSVSLPKATGELADRLSDIASGWYTIKETVEEDYLPLAERSFFSTLDVGAALREVKSAKDAAARIAAMKAEMAPEEPQEAPESEPEPEAEQMPTGEPSEQPDAPTEPPRRKFPTHEDYERIAGPAPEPPAEKAYPWVIVLPSATQTQMNQVALTLKGFGIGGTIMAGTLEQVAARATQAVQDEYEACRG